MPGGYEKSAHLYDLFDTKDNIDFFRHYAWEAGEILDVGAGTGRIAIPLARAGIRVYCVEPSPAMRREFLKKLSTEPECTGRIQIAASDAAGFDFGRQFPAVYLSGCFDHFLDDNQRRAALRNISRHLDAGGKLVFDVFTGLMKSRPLQPAGRVVRDDIEYRRLVGSRRMKNDLLKVNLVFEAYRRGKLIERIEEHSPAAIITREQLVRLLKRAGFGIAGEYGGYDFQPYRPGGDLLIIEALKQIP